MGSGALNFLADAVTLGAHSQYKAQKEAMQAQNQAQQQAMLVQQQALNQQKQSAQEQLKLQQRELEAQEQAYNRSDKYAISNSHQDKADKNSADLTKGTANSFVDTSKPSLGSDDEDEFNQWY